MDKSRSASMDGSTQFDLGKSGKRKGKRIVSYDNQPLRIISLAKSLYDLNPHSSGNGSDESRTASHSQASIEEIMQRFATADKIVIGGVRSKDSAHYHPATDTIHLRSAELTHPREYITALHEIAHMAGQHLEHQESIAYYINKLYKAQEELIADYTAIAIWNKYCDYDFIEAAERIAKTAMNMAQLWGSSETTIITHVTERIEWIEAFSAE